ncbi:MAG TPA: glycosyltransferase [Acidimicrobiia bacterium]|nr:glycosyltransferase [Acidimicrobiia bacterium]
MTASGPFLASVVIPAHDAASVLGEQLAALARQPEAERLEVIVVDNRSSDATDAVARAWADRLLGLRVLDAPERAGQAYARNVGIAAARSERILLCDADDRVDDAWAGHLLTALATADSVAGLVVGWDGKSPPALTASRESFDNRFGFLPAFGSNNAGFTRQAWADVDGFDEAFGSGEDIDLSWRMQLAGHSLAFAPEAIVYARLRETPRAVFRQSFLYGDAQVALYARHGPAGMPRTSTRDGLRRLGSLAVHSPDLLRDRRARVLWLHRAGWRLGRVAGSVRYRTLNL